MLDAFKLNYVMPELNQVLEEMRGIMKICISGNLSKRDTFDAMSVVVPYYIGAEHRRQLMEKAEKLYNEMTKLPH
jgi:hypothetical protein